MDRFMAKIWYLILMGLSFVLIVLLAPLWVPVWLGRRLWYRIAYGEWYWNE